MDEEVGDVDIAPCSFETAGIRHIPLAKLTPLQP
jgi:hypothetical protein